MDDLRIDGSANRGPEIEFSIDDKPVRAFLGETVATALLARGDRLLRTTGILADPRGLYCGMGVCWECAVWVERKGIVQACRLPAEQGLQVRRLRGAELTQQKPHD